MPFMKVVVHYALHEGGGAIMMEGGGALCPS